MLTKEAQNGLENAKTDLKPFLTILGTNQRAFQYQGKLVFYNIRV
jgi:hypothetical protein